MISFDRTIFFLLCFSLFHCTLIVPNQTNPVQFDKPINFEPQTKLELRFSLEELETNVGRGNVLLVELPAYNKNLIRRVNFAVHAFTCSLSDGTDTFAFESVLSSVEETNKAICQFSHSETKYLSANKPYIFTLTFSSKLKETEQIEGITLSLGSSASKNRTILTSVSNFGSVGLQNYYKSLWKNSLNITSATIEVSSGSNPSIIRPFNVFDVNLSVEVLAPISRDDLIVVTIPTDLIQFATCTTTCSISSTRAGGAELEKELQGFAELTYSSPGKYFMTGHEEDLVPGRKFQLKIPDLKAKDKITKIANTNIDNKGNLSIAVYYKNSYVAKSFQNLKIISISAFKVNILNANHKEKFNIYSGMAWPFNFKFKSGEDYATEVFIVIRHANAYQSKNRLNFVPSTCNFQTITALNSEFEKLYCSPLRKDNNYPEIAAQDYNGAGIFFRLPSLTKTVEYEFDVWLYASKCGTASTLVDADTSQTFNFTVDIYSMIDHTKLNENRFDQPIADSNGFTMESKCYEVEKPAGKTPKGYPKFTSAQYTSQLHTDETKFKLLGTEITNFDAVYYTFGATEITCNGEGSPCKIDFLGGGDEFNDSLFYYLNNAHTDPSHLLLKAPIDVEKDEMPIYYLAANHIQYTTEAARNTFVYYIKGRLEIIASSAFLTKGNSAQTGGNNKNCIVSWTLYDPFSFNELPSNLVTNDAASYFRDHADIKTKMWMIESSDTAKQGIDVTRSKLPLNAKFTGIYTLTSVFIAAATTDPEINFFSSYGLKAAKQTMTSNLYFFTDCLTWDKEASKPKNLFEAVDFHFTWQYAADATTEVYLPMRVNRLVKFMMQPQVFQKPPSASNTLTDVAEFHYANGEFNDTAIKNSVCLTRIRSEIINGDDAAGTVVLFMNNVIFFDMDYSTPAALYPLAPVTQGVSAIAVSSPVFNENEFMFESLTSTQVMQLDPTISHYYSYLTSLIWFSGFKTGNITETSPVLWKDLLVPHYCPDSSIPNSPNNYASLLGMTGGADFSKIGSIVSRFATDSAGSLFFFGREKTANNSTAGTFNSVKMKFNRLGKQGYHTDITTYLYDTSAATNCTGYSLLLSESVLFDFENFYFEGLDSTVFPSYTTSGSFYAFGKKFNKAVLMQELSTATSLNISASATTTFVSGVKRPSLEALFKDNLLSTLNKVAFSCASSAVGDNASLSNLLVSGEDMEFHIFIETDESDWTNITFSSDGIANSKDDPVGSFSLAFELPLPNLKGAILKFSGDSGLSSAVCGMTANYDYAGCVSVSNNTFTCIFPVTSRRLSICCHNVVIQDTLSLQSIQIEYPYANTNSLVSANVENVLFKGNAGQPSSNFVFDTGNSNALARTAASLLKIRKAWFTQLHQYKGLSTVKMELDLGMELKPDLSIQISADFSQMSFLGMTPRCNVSVAQLNLSKEAVTEGNLMLESCEITSFENNSALIIIKTRNTLVKCNRIREKNFYKFKGSILEIELTPVSPQKQYYLNYSVQILKSDSTQVTPKRTGLVLELDSSAYAAPPVVEQEELCNLTGIWPRIPGFNTNLTFTFKTAKFKDNLIVGHFNEITILLPMDIFGEFKAGSFYCLIDNETEFCETDDKGFLNILLRKPITEANSDFSLTIVGLKIYKSLSSVKFPCSLNELNQKYTRKAIVTGVGKATVDFHFDTEEKEKILFAISTLGTSQSTPRLESTLKFGFHFDNSIYGSKLPSTLEKSTLIVSLPMQYPLHYYSSLGMKVYMKMQIYDSSSKIQDLPEEKALNNGLGKNYIYRLIGNKLSINLESIAIPANFANFLINIVNIKNPLNPVETTDTMELAIFTEDYAKTYLVYDNFNTLFVKINENKSISELSGYRGLKYEFDTSKFTLDVFDSHNSQANNVILFSGVYNKLSFKLQKTNNKPKNEKLEINFVPSGPTADFKPDKGLYELNTALMQLDFKIGIPCDTLPGKYILNFNFSLEKFYPPAPVLATVPQKRIGVVDCASPDKVPNNAYYRGKCTLSHEPFDKIALKFKSLTSPPIVTFVEEPTFNTFETESFFKFNTNLPSSPLDNTQKYSIYTDSLCFNSNKESLVYVQGDFPIISSNFADRFYYVNADNDFSMASERNALKIHYSPTEYPVQLSCVLVCYQRAVFPSDAQIIKGDKKEEHFNLRYNSAYITDGNTVTMAFHGLVRGNRYKARCIKETTQVDSSDRVVVSQNFDLMRLRPESTELVEIKVQDKTPTRCVIYGFTSNLPQTVSDLMLKYCQFFFSPENKVVDGCTICMDTKQKTTNDIEKVQGTACDVGGASGAASRLLQEGVFPQRMLQDDAVNQTVESTFGLCAVQDDTCATNITEGGDYVERFEAFYNSIKDKEKALQNAGAEILEPQFVSRVTDEENPGSENFAIGEVNFSLGGNYSIEIRGVGTELQCYWMINESVVVPNYIDVKQCSSLSWCGKISLIKDRTKTIRANVNSLEPFKASTNYAVYLVCYNQVVDERLASPVLQIYNFNLKADEVKCTDTTATLLSSGKCRCPLQEGQTTALEVDIDKICQSSASYIYMAIVLLLTFIL